MITDETLYRQFLNGDDDALHELMERYGNHLTFYINAVIHDIHNAEDLMIDVFSYLVVKKPNIKNDGFKPYLYKSARNMALRHVSRVRRRPHFSFSDISHEPKSTDLVETILQTEERNRILYLCMEQLNPSYREALYLIYFEGMCHSEVAGVLGKSERQITNLSYRGKKALGTLLRKEGIEYANY